MPRIKERLGLIFIAILPIIPIMIWAFMQPLSQRFATFFVSLTSIGQVFGLAGIVLFSLTLVLNTRARFLEGYFGGADRMYKMHHILGSIAFSLLLFHPMFLAARFIEISLRDAALFLLPSVYWVTNYGIIALLLMQIFLIITFFVKLKYNRWRFTHQFLGAAFVFASLHVFFIPSDVAKNLFLRYYILFFISAGMLAFFYKTLLGKVLFKIPNYIVEEVRQVNKNVVEISLKPKKSQLKFVPGQFIFISLLDSKSVTSEVHPFTVSSSPGEKNIRLSVKSVGDYTSKLGQLEKGTLAKIEGPFGRFSCRYYGKGQIWIAGGIGITPFLSMSRSLTGSEKIDLYYSVQQKEDAVFLDELVKISSKGKNFKVMPFYSSESGRLSAEFISKESKGLKNKEILICGPLAMMESLKEQFISLGVSKNNIHFEEFNIMLK